MGNRALYDLTLQLCNYNKEAFENYHNCRSTGIKGDFYSEVKPFADKVKECRDKWEPEAILWTIKNKPKNLYPLQIKNTGENIEMVSVRAFFPDSSLKKFNSHVQSIDYVLRRLLDELDAPNSLGEK
ncbi:YppE family protein [Bacillus sp. FSL K6-3431]|uniref:YppE family protein n=1 Tax=Bacillus sp. FSL K6-3431 TaxID=2921500 RepID=UPI0030FAEC9B